MGDINVGDGSILNASKMVMTVWAILKTRIEYLFISASDIYIQNIINIEILSPTFTNYQHYSITVVDLWIIEKSNDAVL